MLININIDSIYIEMDNSVYTDLLDQDNLVKWLKSISETDPNPNIKIAAKKIAFNVSGNKIIESWYYYNELYNKYEFKLITINSSNGFNVVLYSYKNNNPKFIGTVKKFISKPVLPPSNNKIIVAAPEINEIESTYSRKPTITGTAVSSSTITIYIDGDFIGTTIANFSGDWSFTPISNLTTTTHTATATATLNGQTSSISLPITFTILSTTTPTVSFTSPTYDRTPTITGTAVAGSTITVYDGVTSLGTTIANNNGNWSFVPGTDLTYSSHTITATATIDGQISPASSPATLVIEVEPPTVSVTSPTYDRTPTITGTSIAGSTITVYDGITSLGTTITDGSSNWSFVPGTDLSISTHTITATATVSGQTSSASSPANELIIQSVPVPTVTFTSPTDDTTPTITGTAVAGSTVTIYNNQSSIGTTTADGSGNWSFTLT